MSDNGLEVLREFELFKDLTLEELQHVHKLVFERSYERGEYVFLEGQERESVYFIRRGMIKILKTDKDGREHIVNILGKGQMFPHVGFFQDSPYPGTAQVMESAALLGIRCLPFDALLMERPGIMRKLMRVMGEKLVQLQEKLQQLAVFDAHDRVIALLRHFAEEYGRPEPDGIHVKLPVTHGEMAHMIGITRESVNRVCNQLRRDGVLSGDRNEWVSHIDRLGGYGVGGHE
ncbi:Crp/Fnr family transcriptional regulator [Alicyclobacillus kakegawensis]|uniref:Crp/Fnr family transcriptional regulator n=1 Tax=Alicyclobacillus kakegawensis TaxID=392012 RepID=UPI00082AE75A|nr:Crp/Fnr family transcriptional regulator [Alicyclobacillus kakegawensis]